MDFKLTEEHLMIQQAAKTYLNTSNYIRVTLLPEKK